MSTYTDYLISTVGLATKSLFPFADAFGTAASNLGTLATAGLYVASPTLSGTGDEYGSTAKCMATNGTTQLCRIPTAAMPHLTDGTVSNSIVFWWKWDGTGDPYGSPFGSPYGIGFAQDFSGYDNFFSIQLNAQASGFASGNYAAVRYYTAANGNTGAEMQHNGSIFDGAWHMFCATYSTAAGGTLTLFIDGVPGTSVTGVDAKHPSIRPYFGVGAQIANNGTTLDTKIAGSWQHFSYHEVALTATQQFAMADKFNGNGTLKIENPTVLANIFAIAHRQLVGLVMVGDSNVIKATAADTVTNVQGFVITTPTWIYTATGRKIPTYMVGTRQPGAGGTTFLGVNENLVNGTLGTIAHVTNRNLEYWNTNVSSDADASRGFRFDAKYFPSGTLTGANSNIICDTASADWVMDASGAFKFWYEYATFAAAGSGQIVPSVTVNGVVISFTPIATDDSVNAWSYGSTAAATVTAGQTFKFGLASTGHDATGPIGSASVHIVNAGRSSGFSLAALWGNGGHSAYTVCQALADFTNTPLTKLSNFFLQLMLPTLDLGQTPTCILQILEGPNDRNEAAANLSYTYTPGTDTFTTVGNAQSRSRLGYYNNCNTIYLRLKDAWVAQGFDAANFYCIFGPYHQIDADPGDWRMQQLYARAEREMIDSYPTRITRFAGNLIVPQTVMSAAGGYDAGYVHLLRPGYVLMGTATGAEAAQYSEDFNLPVFCACLRQLGII